MTGPIYKRYVMSALCNVTSALCNVMSALCFLHWVCVMFIIVFRFSFTYIELAHPPCRLPRQKLLVFVCVDKCGISGHFVRFTARKSHDVIPICEQTDPHIFHNIKFYYFRDSLVCKGEEEGFS